MGLPDKKQVGNPVIEAFAVAPNPDTDTPFKAAAPTLQAITHFPVRLPTVIPDSPIGRSTPLYVIVDASAHYYKAILAYEPTCSGANFCTHFAVSGTDKQGLAQSELGQPHHTGQQVALTNGITGYFNESISGASGGGNEFLDWEQDGVVYQVVTRAYPRLQSSELIRAANSAILGHS